MFKKLICLMQILALCFVCGCAAINKGAGAVGKGAGKTADVMNTMSEAGVEEVMGEPESNPYDR